MVLSLLDGSDDGETVGKEDCIKDGLVVSQNVGRVVVDRVGWSVEGCVDVAVIIDGVFEGDIDWDGYFEIKEIEGGNEPKFIVVSTS